MGLKLLDADVKVVYDSQGVKREVLISYEKYEEMLEFIERHTLLRSQEAQERLQKSSQDLRRETLVAEFREAVPDIEPDYELLDLAGVNPSRGSTEQDRERLRQVLRERFQ